MRAKNEDIKRLFSYSKQDIIEAIENSWFADETVSGMLSYLESKKIDNMSAKYKEALTNAQNAREAYFDWRRKVITTYGDGNTVKLRDIPTSEFDRGAALEKAWRAAEKKEENLNKKLEHLLNI